MTMPDWKTMSLNAGILREPAPDRNSIVLWLPGERVGNCRYWERLATVPAAKVISDGDLSMVVATSLRVRQQMRSFLGRLFQRLRGPRGDNVWILPTGDTAIQDGERQASLLLVWAAGALEEAHLRRRWPSSQRFQQIGDNLFVVSSAASVVPQQPSLAPASSRQQAEQLLAAARQRGDQRGEAAALADLGLVQLKDGDAQGAIPTLQEALYRMRQFGDRPGETDVLGNLGLAFLAGGQPGCAMKMLQQALEASRAASDRFGERLSLANLGYAHATLRDPAGAGIYYEQALVLARELGDHQQEADALWYLAIQKAELGLKVEAIAWAEASLALFRELGHPQSDWLAGQLGRFRAGREGDALGQANGQSAPASPNSNGAIVASMWTEPSSVPNSDAGINGPGLLRMAITATKSLARFLESGLKTAPLDVQRKRLALCAECPQHTGMRCRICGCFTKVKTWLPHERCPIGRW